MPWCYAEVAGLEVLSCCPERLTRALVANHHRLHALFGELLPPALQLKLSGPNIVLFVDSARQPPTSQEVVAHMALSAVDQQALDNATMPLDDGLLRRRPPPPRYTFLPNLRLWDRDAQALFAVVKESEFDPNRVGLTAEYVTYVLRNRLPALPPWFISGVLTLHARTTFSEDALTLQRQDWPSKTGSAALRSGPEANRALLPLADFFAGELAQVDPTLGEGLSLWQAQAALLIRWGLAGRGSARRAALWKFAERAAVEPVTEALFQECFGLDFATAHQQLTAYLPEAMRDRLALRPASWPRLPDYALRPASDVEIAQMESASVAGMTIALVSARGGLKFDIPSTGFANALQQADKDDTYRPRAMEEAARIKRQAAAIAGLHELAATFNEKLAARILTSLFSFDITTRISVSIGKPAASREALSFIANVITAV